MGDREVPLVGGNQAAVRGPTSGPEDTPTVSERVPARERGSDFTRARLLCHRQSRRNQPPLPQL